MKNFFLISLTFLALYSCSKTESTPPVVNKLSSCDSVSLGLLKSDTYKACKISSITIGTQKWMEENLDIITYRNGDVIPQVTDQAAWAGLTTGAWCYYNNDPANGAKYGKLYNWYAVNDPRGLAPKGSHIPTDAEWTTLSTFLGGEALAGGKIKTTTGWIDPNKGATNESGFAGLPGGNRYDNGMFGSIRNSGAWWSATESSTTPWYRIVSYFDVVLNRNNEAAKTAGLSVRCLRD